MIFPFYISPDAITIAFSHTRLLLNGNEPVLFDAMNLVHPQFSLPQNPNDYNNKNREIDRILSRRSFGGGTDLSFKLIDKILRLVIDRTIALDITILISYWQFTIQPNCFVKLASNEVWLYSHSVTVNHLQSNFSQEHILTLKDRNFGIVVPEYIVQYFHTALNCFSQHQYTVCLALTSIIVEGTLKDVLITRNYQFTDRNLPRYVSGLGVALQKARTVEFFLAPADLPDDLDAVIKPIRNNLVHLSGDAFATPLPYLNNHNDIANFTLGDFVKDPNLIHDLLSSVSYFVEKMYQDLRAAGHVVP